MRYTFVRPKVDILGNLLPKLYGVEVDAMRTSLSKAIYINNITFVGPKVDIWGIQLPICL